MTDVSVEELYKQFCLDMLDAIEKWENGEDTPSWFWSKAGLCSNLEGWFEIKDHKVLDFQKHLFGGFEVYPFNSYSREYHFEQDTDTIYKNEARLAWLRKYAGKEG